VLIFDQFEQWPQATDSTTSGPLTKALRQCDGVRVQALLMVRDDYWLPLSRFMHDLEEPLEEGSNTALVDLFDLRHARKVLEEFERSSGRLPENLGHCSAEPNAFLDLAMAALSEGGKIIPVRLSMFVEMLKEKHWTPTMLREMGGLEGVGVAFLEEMLGAD